MTNLKTAICCIACQENDYIREWIDYYKKLGFTHIFIYDNNKSFEANEYIKDVTEDYLKDKFITIIDKRDVVKNTFQVDCYNECYRTYKNNYDWFLFIDCDEFLWLKKYDNITDFLTQNIFSDFHVIKINWLSYNDNGHIYKTKGSVLERFPNPSDITKENIEWENKLLKSFVRGGLDEKQIFIGIHTPLPLVNNEMLAANISDPNYIKIKQQIEQNFKWCYRTCFADGTESFDICYPNCFSPDDPRYDDAVLKHYRTKSCQEYVENKVRRGFQDCAKQILNAGTYFYFNEYSKEKMDYLLANGVEPPILLINSDTTDVGEMMCIYAAAKYLVKDIEHDYLIYWKNNNIQIALEKIKNSGLFADCSFFTSTLLQNIGFQRNCSEYHYIVNQYPENKYIYKPLIVEPGRNIKICGPMLSPKCFDMNFLNNLYNNNGIKEQIIKLYEGYDLNNTAAILINEYTAVEEILTIFNLYNNNPAYMLISDNIEAAASIVYEAYEIYQKNNNTILNISWLNVPHSMLSRDLVKLYTFAVCRVCFVHMSDTVAWMGTMLNEVECADIIYSMDDNLIYHLMIPENDKRYKNLKMIMNGKKN
ncbi:MAG: hypothetical protein [Wendovervirus sonii]|uniref:Glycosyltransferase n=1 Tax=phage Lak_Megaphage_Sonny TaxID=3109229 RepID=A0ABZ0Z6G7_9CAUD|nr:MAG: hypothetical protein [phage Lak_Megaphage_Sonny]